VSAYFIQRIKVVVLAVVGVNMSHGFVGLCVFTVNWIL